MTYIETKKAEAREKMLKIIESGTASDAYLFSDTLIDTLLNDIESRVLPKKSAAWGMSRGEDRSDQNVRDDTISQIEENFQHLRTGVETEWRCECNTQLPYFGTKTVDGFIRCQNCKRVYTTTGELANNQ